MKRAEGDIGVSLLECVNPRKNKWRVRWDIQPKEDNESIVTYMEEEFDHRPTDEEIKSLVIGWHNEQIDNAILMGMTYNGVRVWLSQENQFNYKAAYDLAVQTGGKTLPVVFKFGTDERPVYKQFTTLNELSNFYNQAMMYIQNTLVKGWKTKDSIDFTKYR
jgi:hypothetical protein